MSVLQDLIVKFNSKKNAELYTRIIKEIQSAEQLLSWKRKRKRDGIPVFRKGFL